MSLLIGIDTLLIGLNNEDYTWHDADLADRCYQLWTIEIAGAEFWLRTAEQAYMHGLVEFC